MTEMVATSASIDALKMKNHKSNVRSHMADWNHHGSATPVDDPLAVASIEANELGRSTPSDLTFLIWFAPKVDLGAIDKFGLVLNLERLLSGVVRSGEAIFDDRLQNAVLGVHPHTDGNLDRVRL